MKWPAALAFLIATTLAFAQSASLEGDWKGVLDAGGAKLRLVLKLKKAPSGYTATLDSVDQNAAGIPVTSFTQEGAKAGFKIDRIGGEFKGKLNDKADTMTGTWSQGDATLPLELKRETAATPAPSAGGLPAPMTGFDDEGTFLVYMNEDRLGVVQAKVTAAGAAEAKVTVSMAGQTVETTSIIEPDTDGRWKKLTNKSPAATVTITRDGVNATSVVKDKTNTIVVRENSLPMNPNSLPQTSVLLRRYDRAKGGSQVFPIFTGAATPVDLTVQMKESVERSISGKDLKLTRFQLSLPGVDLFAWAGADNKIYLLDVPQQKAVVVREGYDALRKPVFDDPLLSKPSYEVEIERNVKVPMRDGIKLATDIYKPAGAGKAPMILVRTPYKKDLSEIQGRFYARRGYVYAVQDCRGRFGSEGVWEPFINESKDGYDAIEWLAKQPYTDGKIGLIGGSYLGWVQWWAASQHPPHLVTMIPNVSPPDPFYNIPYEYGVFFMMGAVWWAEVLETGATADLSGATMAKIGDKKMSKRLSTLPVIDLDKAVLGKENPYWRKWIQHPSNDAYWQPANFLDKLKDVRIPVFHQSGWYDGDGIGTKLNYLKMASFGHPNQKLIVGPWGHTDTAGRMIGDRDFGAIAIVDLQRDYLRWFDYWLKGVDNGIIKEPLVKVFVMGSNKWLQGPKYPLPETKFQKLYLSSAGNANTVKGDGKLTFDATGEQPPDKYVYDPGDPTPSPAAYEESEEEGKKVKSAVERQAAAKEYHNKVVTERKDILVYESAALEKPLTFAGPVSAALFASSSARDTDWFVSLMEIDEKGQTFPLGSGKIRARFRKSMSKPEMLKAGEIVEYQLDLWHIGITIPAGRKLRVEVASAVFPLFSRNLNTGGHNEMETKYVPANQTIYHDAKRPSHILLPVIE